MFSVKKTACSPYPYDVLAYELNCEVNGYPTQYFFDGLFLLVRYISVIFSTLFLRYNFYLYLKVQTPQVHI